MKIISLSGIENSGKTYTTKTMVELFKRHNISYASTHFPSDELCQSDYFKNLLMPHKGYDVERKFVDALIKEERKFLEKNIKKGIIFIDRFFWDSLVYQGIKDSHLMKYIIDSYESMFYDLEISPNDFRTYLFLVEIEREEGVLNETKKKYDDKNAELYEKFMSVYNMLGNEIISEYAKNTKMFNSDYYKSLKKPYSREVKNAILCEYVHKIATDFILF